MVNFKVSREEARTIGRIVDRALALAGAHGIKADAMELSMDVTACHANGCPLRLADLLAAPDGDFGHDVFGIRRYIDRKTGRMTDCFVPRFAEAEPAEAATD